MHDFWCILLHSFTVSTSHVWTHPLGMHPFNFGLLHEPLEMRVLEAFGCPEDLGDFSFTPANLEVLSKLHMYMEYKNIVCGRYSLSTTELTFRYWSYP